MTATYKWYEFYKSAVLETDWSKMDERIRAAEGAIRERETELSLDHGGIPEERKAIAALRGELRRGASTQALSGQAKKSATARGKQSRRQSALKAARTRRAA